MAYTKYTYITSESGFTCTNGVTVTYAQMDSTLIGINRDITALSTYVSSIVHEQETDRYLKQGQSQEYDSYKNFSGSFDGVEGSDSDNTVTFALIGITPFSSVNDFEIEVFGLIVDEDDITQRVEVGYKSKTVNGFIAMPTVDCRIVWRIISNLRARTGI